MGAPSRPPTSRSATMRFRRSRRSICAARQGAGVGRGVRCGAVRCGAGAGAGGGRADEAAHDDACCFPQSKSASPPHKRTQCPKPTRSQPPPHNPELSPTHLSLSEERDGLPQLPQHVPHFAILRRHQRGADLAAQLELGEQLLLLLLVPASRLRRGRHGAAGPQRRGGSGGGGGGAPAARAARRSGPRPTPQRLSPIRWVA